MNKSNPNTRRKVLALLGGGLLGATQLPKTWTRPIVNTVMLPAHAQTTSDTGTLPGEDPLPTHFRSDIAFTLNVTSTDSGLLSLVIPDAQAGEAPPVSVGDLMIDSPNGTDFTAKLNIFDYYQSTLTLNAMGVVGGAPANFDATLCNVFGIGTISVSDIQADGASYSIVLTQINGEISNGILPVGTGEPADSSDCPF